MEAKKLTQDQIEWLNKCTKENWSSNWDGSVNVFSDFDCSGQGLSNLMGVEFGFVRGSFDCSNNKLKSLKGAPYSIGGDFDCSNNELETLEGITKETGKNSSSGTGGGIYCSNNKLTSLKGLPKIIWGDFDCSNNLLETLEGAPKRVNCDFDCSSNKLVTLIGGPQMVGGNRERTEDFKESNWSYKCSGNSISDMELFKAYHEYKKALNNSKKLLEKTFVEKAKNHLNN